MSPSSRSTHLSIIRVALLGGVVVMGVVAIYLTRGGILQPLDEQTLEVLRTAFVALLGVVGVAMFYFWRKRTALSSDDDPSLLNIVGWALGESTAVFGAVILFLSGDLSYYLIGVVLMLVSFVFFQIPND